MARWVLVSVLVLGSVSTVPAGTDSVEIFRRSRPAAVRVGVVEIREARNVPVETEKGRVEFPLVVRIDFFLDTRAAEAERDVREPRGEVVLLLRPDFEQERALHEELEDSFRSLGAGAFLESFAGLDPMSRPWRGIAERAVEPSFGCFLEQAGGHFTSYGAFARRSLSQVERMAGLTFRLEPLARAPSGMCSGASVALDSATPKTIRTDPDTPTLLETVVRVDTAFDLERESFADSLTPLPHDAVHTFERNNDPHAPPRETPSDDGSRYEEIRRTMTSTERFVTVPAHIDVDKVGRNSWVSRWTVETVERKLGPSPTTRVVRHRSLSLALLPSNRVDRVASQIVPMKVHESQSRPIRFYGEGLLSSVGKALDREADVDIDTVMRFLREPPIAIPDDGWIEVICPDRGDPVYGLPPAKAAVAVTNRVEFCSKVEEQLLK